MTHPRQHVQGLRIFRSCEAEVPEAPPVEPQVPPQEEPDPETPAPPVPEPDEEPVPA